MIDLNFLEELMLIKKVHQKSKIFVTMGIFQIEFKFQPNVFNGCHDVLMMSMNLSDIAILNINHADYRCIITGISKCQTINLMQNIDLSEKSGTL